MAGTAAQDARSCLLCRGHQGRRARVSGENRVDVIKENVARGYVAAAAVEDGSACLVDGVAQDVVVIARGSTGTVEMDSRLIAVIDDIVSNGVVVAADVDTIENRRAEHRVRCDGTAVSGKPRK